MVGIYKRLLGFSVLSFMPIGLLGQAMALNTLKAVENIFTKPFYKSSIDLAEVLSELPVGSYWILFFNRYYKSPLDLYDTEERKKRKRKLILKI